MADCANKASQGRPPFAFWGWIVIAFWGFLATGAAVAQPVGERWIDMGSHGEFHVVLPEGASPELQLAATLFQRYWKRCTGYEPGISTENGGKINVWLGRALASHSLIPAHEFEDLGDEGFFIRTFTPATRDAAVGAKKQFILAGATDLATVYAVCDFFTRYLHVRWLAPGVVVAPRSNFHFPVIDLRVEAGFPERYLAGVAHGGTPEEIAEFCYAHKLTASNAAASFAPASVAENPATGLHAAGLFTAQPACFALASDQTTRDPTQICPSAPETRAALLAALKAAIDLEPARTTWSVSPGKTAACACPACAASAEAEGGPMGSWLGLVNGLAEDLTAAYPDKSLRLHVLAEGVFRAPPKQTRPATQVAIEVSTAGSNWAVPLRSREDARNVAFVADLRGWSRATEQLYVRHAVVDPGNPLVPLPNVVFLREDVQLFAQVDLAGVTIVAGNAEVSPYQADSLLRANLAARFLWEPDLPRQSEMPELLRAIYGPAAPAVDAYLVNLEGVAATANPASAPQTAAAWWRSAAPGLQEAWGPALAMTLPPVEQQRLYGSALPVLAVVHGCTASESFVADVEKAGLGDQRTALQVQVDALCAAK